MSEWPLLCFQTVLHVRGCKLISADLNDRSSKDCNHCSAGQLPTAPSRAAIRMKEPRYQSYWPLTLSVALSAPLITQHFEKFCAE